MVDIKITRDEKGGAYLALSEGEIRESVSLDDLEQADGIPALESLVLDFDFYGRLSGIRVVSGAESALPPRLLDEAERA
jgi:hypothetical protein